ncbi:NAD-dependent protein deacylase [Halalkalicoccus jeotgali]|uniref:Sir2-type HDAC (Histone deacetylase) n=1 Tax=Halalkalicoccus jeotgali (strain DSM 18796 / CECT 7217 / JCM 14584 / KCTC 4019 / B3) TaxID=795797 RepID=D8J9G0_HALJB|nr:NAD-dependent protein deacylase [Halalkalicoccus jeotgali]ADJ14372.1 Sir2-type HDAC (histone deacetylase) [Halalkalicoccus jeotgali B3]ELY40633.1 Sir2-type histone deacetylase [Halalkalicoccus jeotgali B3]
MDDAIDRLASAIRRAESTVALTGAGLSTASGIPDFRGEEGIWNAQFDPADFRIERFLSDPAGFWTDRLALHEAMFGTEIEPNVAHEALATMESRGRLDAVITQNTDGLHAAAGSREVFELHGNAHRVVCMDCGHRGDAEPVRERVRGGERPPRCDCGGLLKPDVVLFGELLPEAIMAEAQRRARESDVFLAVGSSLTVEPAGSLPKIAARDGFLAVCNFDPTPHDDRAAVVLHEDVTEVLPALAARLA